KVIPEDATGFLTIRNLKELDNDIVAISTQLGFPLGPEGMFPAPLEWVKTSLQLSEGLNDNGGMALVLLNCSDVKTLDQIPDRLVIYIAATNPKALLTSLGGEETPEGAYKVQLGGASSVAAIKNDYVLIAKAPGPDAEDARGALTLATKARGEGVIKSMAPDRVKAYARQDVFLWVSFRGLSEDLRKQITEGVGELFNNLTAAGRRGRSDTEPADEQSLGVGMQFNKFLEQGQEISGGLSLEPKVGLTLSGYSRVKEDSDAAKMIAAMASGRGPLLAGLPDESAVLAAGAVLGANAEVLQQMRQAMERMAAQVSKLDRDPGSPLNPEGLKPLIDLYMDLLGSAKRCAVSISNLATAEDAGQAGVIGVTIVAEVNDSKAWREQLHKGFDEIKKIIGGVAKADGMDEQKLEQTLSAFVWKEDAGQVEGATVDQMVVELDKFTEATPEDITKIKAVLGEEGIVIRVASVGEKHVVITFGGGEKRFADVLAVVKGNQAPLAKNKDLTKIATRLPRGGARVVEAYLNLEHLLGVIDAVATKIDKPLPVRLTLQNSAPLAFTTVNVDKTSQEMTLLIPAELISSAAEMVRQQLLPMIMMGGLGGGGEGGGFPGIEVPESGNDSNDDSGDDQSPQPDRRRPRERPTE
ncbi:MAG: hypothetical protein HY718_04290, partial [Planctomycetes bacterium]|nr:hypothetical protein [Planctomycetota bacterium]